MRTFEIIYFDDNGNPTCIKGDDFVVFEINEDKTLQKYHLESRMGIITKHSEWEEWCEYFAIGKEFLLTEGDLFLLIL